MSEISLSNLGSNGEIRTRVIVVRMAIIRTKDRSNNQYKISLQILNAFPRESCRLGS